MFYNNATIFQTTFDQSINIPKLGEYLSNIVENFKQIYEITSFESNKYDKIICETQGISIIILKLGEESNIALFFKAEEAKELKLSSIRRYLTKIEELIDMDKKELVIQKIVLIEDDIEKLKKELELKQNKIEELRNLMDKSIEDTEYETKTALKEECEEKKKECLQIEDNISEKQKIITSLRGEIEKNRN